MIWVWAKKYPKSRWLILRNSYTTLQQTTLVTFQSLLNAGLQGDVVDWKQQTLTATLYNGSQVFFMAESYEGDKELNRFRGLEVNGVGIDEINEIQEVTFYKIIERAGSWQHSKGCPIKVIATCNPTGNWVKDLFYDKWERNELPSQWAYVTARIFDNPHIDPAYLETLKLMPEKEYEKFVEGDWNVVFEGQLFPADRLKYFIPSDIEPYKPDFKFLAVDPADTGGDNLSAPTCELYGNEIYVTGVIFSKEGTDVTVPELVELICAKRFHMVHIEGNGGWGQISKTVQEKVWNRPSGQDVEIVATKAYTNKQIRILSNAAFIKNHMRFLSPEYWTPQYKSFMKTLTAYLREGGSNQVDDAPDSLVMASEYYQDNFRELW